MEKFPVLISSNEWTKFVNGETILNSNNRFKLDSLSVRTLLSDLGNDFTQQELEEVYKLEIDNLKRLIKSFVLAHDKEAHDKLYYASNIFREYVQIMKRENMTESQRIRCLMLIVLSDFDRDLNKTKFEGKIPTKMFSFRQDTAQKWFQAYVNFVILAMQTVYEKLGKQHALAYLVANSVYYLNKSQTFRFYQKEGESINDCIFRISKEFIGGDYSKFISSDIPLFKDI